MQSNRVDVEETRERGSWLASILRPSCAGDNETQGRQGLKASGQKLVMRLKTLGLRRRCSGKVMTVVLEAGL